MTTPQEKTLPLYTLGTLASPRPNPDRLSASGEIEYLPAPRRGVAEVLLARGRELPSEAARPVRTTGRTPEWKDDLTWVDYRQFPLPRWVWLGALAAFAVGFVVTFLAG